MPAPQELLAIQRHTLHKKLLSLQQLHHYHQKHGVDVETQKRQVWTHWKDLLVVQRNLQLLQQRYPELAEQTRHLQVGLRRLHRAQQTQLQQLHNTQQRRQRAAQREQDQRRRQERQRLLEERRKAIAAQPPRPTPVTSEQAAATVKAVDALLANGRKPAKKKHTFELYFLNRCGEGIWWRAIGDDQWSGSNIAKTTKE